MKNLLHLSILIVALLSLISAPIFADTPMPTPDASATPTPSAPLDTKSRDSDGNTPLIIAAKNDDIDALNAQIAAGADVNAKNNSHWTALLAAVFADKMDCVTALISAGADAKVQTDQNETTLMYAVRAGDANCVKALITAGADLNVKDGNGDPPLIMAARIADSDNPVSGIDDCVTALVAAGIADQASLAKYASDDSDFAVRKAAASALTDQSLLTTLASSSQAAELRLIAVSKITDESFLLGRVRDDQSAAVRMAALGSIQSQDALSQVASQSYYKDLRDSAYNRLTDTTQTAKVDAANTARAALIVQIGSDTNAQDLADRSLNGGFDDLCLAAITQLSDQTLLANVAMKTTDRDIAKVALSKLTDKTALAQVAGGATDNAVRIAAKVKTGKITWDSVFSDATTADTAKDLGDALAAVSLSPNQDGINGAVTDTCLTLIRKGDESRIPELVDLLNRYGDVPLCEDYLNCGQPDLGSAGENWANVHGYDVGTGDGSNRATWGSAK